MFAKKAVPYFILFHNRQTLGTSIIGGSIISTTSAHYLIHPTFKVYRWNIVPFFKEWWPAAASGYELAADVVITYVRTHPIGKFSHFVTF